MLLRILLSVVSECWHCGILAAILVSGGTSASEGHIVIIIANITSVLKLDPETPDNYEVIVSNLSNAVAVDYDFERKLLVWSDVQSKGIYSADIETGGQKTMIAEENVLKPGGLAVDWIYGNVYWTDIGTKTISVASLDGKMRIELFKDLDTPRGIVVDPSEGWMFWADFESSKIERSGMDGTFRSVVAETGYPGPSGLAVDFDSRRIYWYDFKSNAVHTADYDGSDAKELKYYTFYPSAIDIFQDSLYLADPLTRRFSTINIVTDRQSSHLFGVPLAIVIPKGLKVYHRAKQPKGVNHCVEQNAACSYLCLPAPVGTGAPTPFTCACPDGKECPNTVRSQSALQDSYSLNKILIGTSVSLIIVLCLVGFYIYKRNSKGTNCQPKLNC